ncbi:MAG: FHA domain-containing protein [Planctomycetes bacterium]|nr:FHA domain-containing protein [Planctomycetota bacterium]
MSFRLFIYYCAICGGWAALAGWALGRGLAPSGGVEESAVKGLFLGLAVALGVGLVDALAVASLRRPVEVLERVLLAVAVGCLGGWLGGTVGEHFHSQMADSTARSAALVAGWTITGLLIGAAVSTFDLMTTFALLQDGYGARRKLRNGLLGGVVGGAVGGVLSLLVKGAPIPFFEDKDPYKLWSPTALGFIVLGLAIGFLIGLAQVLLREAWVRVEAGFRAGRELILSKPEVTIGRAESSDIGLFGDAGVERLHARIIRRDTAYYLDDAGTPGGTFLNEVRIARPTPIRSGDTIRVGNSVLRFGERVKKKGA